MPVPLKIFLTLLGVLIALLLGVVVLIKVQLTPEKVRAMLIPLAEEQLQRKLDVGDIRIGIFSGVSLANLRVMQPDGAEEFISAESMSLKYQFWPLLTGKIVIDEVRLEQPKILIVRTADGRFNFSDLLPQEETLPRVVVPATEPIAAKQTTTESPFNLLVNQVAIKNGELIFVDQLQNPRSPYRYSLSRLDLQAKQITLDRSFPLQLSADFNGSQIVLAGNYDISKQSGDVDLQITALDLVQFAPYYRDQLPGKLGAATLGLNLEALVADGKISSKGKVLLTKVDLLLDEFPDAPFEQADLKADYAIDYQPAAKTLELSTLLLDLNGIGLGVSGNVQFAAPQPRIDLSLLLNKFDLRKLSQGLPAALVQEIINYRLIGTLDGKLALSGRPADGIDLLRNARFELNQVQADLGGKQVGLSGILNYAGQAVQADNLKLTLAGQSADVSFKATKLFDKPIRGEFQLVAERLDLNQFSSGVQEVNGHKAQPGPSPETASKLPQVQRQQAVDGDIGPFDIPVELQGSLAVTQLLYKQLTLNRMSADLQLKNNQLKVTNLRSEIADGKLQATTDINLGVKGLAYAGQVNISQANLTTLVAGLLPDAQQSISGQLHWQNNFAGRGTTTEKLLKVLQAKGVLQVGKGKITGSPLLAQVSNFLSSPDLKVLSFDELTGNYDLRNGVAQLNADLNSSKTRLRPAGSVGLDGALDIKLDARLAPVLLKNLGADKELKKMITDDDGWGFFPLTINGSVSSPRVGFDSKQLQKQAGKKVTEELTDKLLDKLGTNGDEDKESMRQLLDGTLKKLFGN